MTKTKPIKAQAWAVMSLDGKVLIDPNARPHIYLGRSQARNHCLKDAGERVVRVEITVTRV